MRRTSNGFQKKFVDRWLALVSTYKELRDKPTIRLILRFLISLVKVAFPVILRKLLDYFFRS